MDIRIAASGGSIISLVLLHKDRRSDPKTRSCFNFTTFCSGKGSRSRRSPQNGNHKNNDDDDDTSGGDEISRDWDKAWSSFRKQKNKKSKRLLSQFSPDKYVSWNPRRSDYPLSEEVDPIRRTEKSNLRFWNSPTFTLGGAIVLVTFLLIYTITAPLPIK